MKRRPTTCNRPAPTLAKEAPASSDRSVVLKKEDTEKTPIHLGQLAVMSGLTDDETRVLVVASIFCGISSDVLILGIHFLQ